MAGSDNGMEKMFAMWQEGQDAFFGAQKEMAETFANTFAAGAAPKPKDPAMQGYEAFQDFIKAWAPSWDPASAMSMTPSSFAKNPDSMFSIFDPSTWMTQTPEQLKVILQSIASAPQFADLVMPQSDAAKGWQEMMDFQEASSDFAKVIYEAWQRSFQAYAKNHSVEDLKSGKVEDALNSWLKLANKELLNTQGTADFMEAQTKLLRASMALKKRQTEQAEAWCAAYQIPTRTEIDDLIQTVHGLRKEIRTLKRDLAEAKK